MRETTSSRGPQILIFDADDTLWENNVIFERVIESYFDWLDHPALSPAEGRAVLDEIERANTAVHGYGTKVFQLCLRQCCERLRGRPLTPPESAMIDQLTAVLVDHEIELMPGVAETLTRLAERHDLLLLTKGDTEEQQRKLDASKLAHRFTGIHIVPEKNVATYRSLLDSRGLAPERTWMIGNSPRSDIRPARMAGMSAVFIPHPHTWVLEHDVVDATDERILTLARFADLLDHF